MTGWSAVRAKLVVSRVEVVAFLSLIFVVTEEGGVSGVVGLPMGFLWDLDNREVSVVRIVKVAGIVNSYRPVGRPRSGGVGWVEQMGDFQGVGGGNIDRRRTDG